MREANEKSLSIEPTFDSNGNCLTVPTAEFHHCKVATVENLLNMGVKEMKQRRGNIILAIFKWKSVYFCNSPYSAKLNIYF